MARPTKPIDSAVGKISLTGPQQTMLITLWARSQDARRPEPILNDQWSAQTLTKLDYDFRRFEVDRGQESMISLRGRCLDRWTSDFIASHDRATVLHLACGLDSRCLRLGWGAGVRWVDVDLPDVVALRKKLLPEPEGDYTLIAASVLDDRWLHAIPLDRPTIIAFEGLAMYLPVADGELLIKRLMTHFGRSPYPGQIIFDAVGSFTITMQDKIKSISITGSRLYWCIDEPGLIERLDESGRLRLRDRARYADLEDFRRVPNPTWMTLWVFWYLPWLRNVWSMLRYEF